MKIKTVATYIIFFVSVCSFGFAGNNNSYLQKDELIELANTIRNDRVYYNLGVIYYREGETGRAVLNFKRARLLNPYDNLNKDALNEARRVAGAPSYIFETSPIQDVLLFPFTVFSMNALVAVGIIFFLSGSIALSFVFVGTPAGEFLSRIKKIKIWCAVFIIAGMVYITASIIRHRVVFDRSQAVAVENARIFQLPEEDASVIGMLDEGIECRIESENGGFFLIRSIDNKFGWVIADNIEALWE
jgi:hypothetical protein